MIHEASRQLWDLEPNGLLCSTEIIPQPSHLQPPQTRSSDFAEGCNYDLTLHCNTVIPFLLTGSMNHALSYSTRVRALESLAYVCEAINVVELPDVTMIKIANLSLDAVLSVLMLTIETNDSNHNRKHLIALRTIKNYKSANRHASLLKPFWKCLPIARGFLNCASTRL